MNVVGIDFGSHACSIALWNEEKDTAAVIADDMGSRTIPTMVAFRGEEIITGHAALSQQHKNPTNTFEDVAGMLLNPDVNNVFVPVLDKEIPVEELASNFFRNIHNQVKQQVGKVIRECVISLPTVANDDMVKRLIASAQAGGIRVKSVLVDHAAALMSYSLDTPAAGICPSSVVAKVVVVDIGWTKATASLYNVHGGMYKLIHSVSTKAAGGQLMVDALTQFCAKDFLKKCKFPCSDNKRSMIRLRKDCEAALKQLSTGTEAMIAIDSLCEGCDYQGKVSRARFEDLGLSVIIQVKKLVQQLLVAAADTDGENLLAQSSVTHVCVVGGLSAVPKIQSTIKALFADNATVQYPRLRAIDPAETHCYGAVLHGKQLCLQGLLDNAPTNTDALSLNYLTNSIVIKCGDASATVVARGALLPCTGVVAASLPEADGKGCFQVGAIVNGDVVVLGDVCCSGSGAVTVSAAIGADGSIDVKVTAKGEESTTVVGELNIPAAV